MFAVLRDAVVPPRRDIARGEPDLPVVIHEIANRGRQRAWVPPLRDSLEPGRVHRVVPWVGAMVSLDDRRTSHACDELRGLADGDVRRSRVVEAGHATLK